MIDHDRLFKELLSTFFLDFIELFLPQVRAYLEPNSFTLLEKEIFTDVTEGDRHEADLVVQVRFQEREAYFLIHTEHQSTVESQFDRRMFRYFARLHEKHGLPIYPVVIYSHDTPKRRLAPGFYQVAFPDKTILEFHYTVIQLNQLDWRDYLEQSNPVASALMSKMRIAPKDRPKVKLECLRLLATLRLNPAKMQLISGFVDTYLRLNAQEQGVFQQELATIEPSKQEGVMQIVTSWMQEGIEQGMEQGLQRERSLILRLLSRRVGEISSELQAEIQQLSVEQLENLGEALLDFTSVADLVGWLQDCNSERRDGMT